MALTKTDTTAPSVTTLLPAVGSEEIKASINKANMSHVIDRLTKLYVDPVKATVRETVSNATDATVALPEDQRKPVELTLPTELEAYFTVKDYGIGMSLQTVRSVFADYGATTKTNDLKAIGSYGLGGKSPLAYTDSFEVTTTHAGVTTEFVMARSGGETRTTIRSSWRTGAEAGTTVRIPVQAQDIYRFKEAVSVYQLHSRLLPVMVDGEISGKNLDYYFAGDAVIYADEDGEITGRVFIRKSWVSSYFSRVGKDRYYSSSVGDGDLSFSLSGWLYRGDGSTAIDLAPNVVVEIVPALVNFDSSRDSITHDQKHHMLTSRVVTALAQPEIAKATFAQVRNFSRQQLSELMAKADRVFDVVAGDKVLFANHEYPISLLDSKFGFNPLVVSAVKDFESLKSVRLALSKNQDHYTRGGFAYWHESYRKGDLDISVTSTMSVISKRYDEDAPDLSVGHLGKELMGKDKTVVMVYSCSDADMRKVLRQRDAIFAGARSSWIFTFTKQAKNRVNQEDLRYANIFLGEESILHYTAKELFELVKPDIDLEKAKRSTQRKHRDQEILTGRREFWTLKTEKLADPNKIEELGSHEMNRSSELMCFQDVLDTDAIILMGDGWKNTYYGMKNAGVDVSGRSVVIYKYKLTGAEASQLLEYRERFYFNTSYPLTATSLKELAKDRCYSASALKTTLESLTLEQLIRSQLAFSYRGVNKTVLAEVKPYLDQDDSDLLTIFDAYITYDGSPYTSAAAEETRPVFVARYGEGALKALMDLEHLTRELSRENAKDFDRSVLRTLLTTSASYDLSKSSMAKSALRRLAKEIKTKRNAKAA